MPYFESQGIHLYYKENGQGKPLIFLHGFGLDMRQWETQVEYFSPLYRVITLDARGHGKSSSSQGKVNPDIFRKDVIALMDFLNISRAAVCGLSMGGHVAIQTAIYARERVESLILIGAICTNQFNLYERVTVPINRICQRLLPMNLIAWSISIGMGNFNSSARIYIRNTVKSMNHNIYNRTWKAVTTMESRADLNKITCPTLILIGDHDYMTRRQQPYLHKHIQDSRQVTIKNAHHGSNLDNPEQVNQEIFCFLSSINKTT